MKKNKKFIKILAFLLVYPVMLIAPGCSKVVPEFFYDWVKNDDITQIKSRIVESTLAKQEVVDIKLLQGEIGADGAFDSVEYLSDRKDFWAPLNHLNKTLCLQKAVYSPQNAFYMDKDILAKINLALEYWAEKNYVCEWNNWYNNIGICTVLADCMLFENKGLKKESKDILLNKLYSSSAMTDAKFYNVKARQINSTGGNLTDNVVYSLKYVVAKEDGSALKWLTKLIENELRPFGKKSMFAHRYDNEGIKPDMSFQQHFELLYLGGYGEVFCDGINKYISFTNGTQYQLDTRATNFYADFIIDGMSFAMRNGFRDINASGRGIARPDQLKGILPQVKAACEQLLLREDIARRQELIDILSKRVANNDIGAGGHKYFYNSDYSVYNDKNYFATVRSASKRTKNSEALNGENVMGHYLGAGATMFYNNGDEYFNILPLWDWNKVPGTTTIQGYLPIGGDNTYSRMGKTAFVGGASNGKIGVNCLDYSDNGVKAKKAWFMFEEGVVCLGSDIKSSKKGEVFTSINQTLSKGNIVFSKNGVVAEQGFSQTTGAIDWIFNDGISYLTSDNIVAKVENKQGDWKTINTRLASKTENNNVFEIGISHGEKVSKGKYNYTVLMNTTTAKTAEYYANPTLVTLANSAKIQAVWNAKTNTLQAIFWEKGSISLPDGNVLSVDKPCAVIVEKTSEGVNISVSDPSQKQKKIDVKINENKMTVNFE
ncbi:MAG: polysaccharide lyase family 8 super-sandwich domain-containing protein, partial [Clostridia bacterium]